MSRWATTPRSADAILYGSMPMSIRRVTAFGASLVWSVESTRWPVSDACSAICAVSWSRISPISTTSGSCRRIDRSAEANVRPAFSCTWTCTMFSPRRYSTGSSTVTMLTPSLWIMPDGRVERGGLARAGRSGHQQDALLGRQQGLHPLLLVLVHPERVEAQHRGALAQDPDHDLLAQRCRQGRDPEVHRLAVHRDASPAVLGPEAVGDVEPGHDLDAGDEGQARLARNLHDLPQHAVDAVAHHHAALDGLDVDVARPAGDAVRQHDVHQPDDRPLAGLLGAGRGLFIVLLQLPDIELARRCPRAGGSSRRPRSGTARRSAAG